MQESSLAPVFTKHLKTIYRFEIQKQEMKDIVERENQIIKDTINHGSTEFQKLEVRIDQESADRQKLETRIDQESNDLRKLQNRIDEDFIDCQRLEKETADLNIRLVDFMKQTQAESQTSNNKLCEDEIKIIKDRIDQESTHCQKLENKIDQGSPNLLQLEKENGDLNLKLMEFL